MKKPFEYYIFIQSGSALEDKDQAGISHFLEHLVFDYSLFKNKSGLNDFLVENNIYDSAEVNKLFTFASFLPLNKKQLEELRGKVKNLIKDPIFSEEGFDKQKRVILEESAYYQDLPFDILDNEFCKFSFPGTGLDHPILGNIDSIESLDLKDLKSWHKEYYAEGRIFEIIFNKKSGEIKVLNSDNIKKPPKLKLSKKSGSNKIKKGLTSKGVAFGWYLNDLDKKERVILDIIRNIIGSSSKSFIYKHLIEELNIVYESNIYLDHFNGLSVLSPQLFSTKPERVVEEFESYKKKIKKEGIDKDLFKEAKRLEEHLFSLPEENAPYIIGEELAKNGTLVLPKERLEILNNITKGEAENYMKKLFKEEEFKVLVY